jgi:hypothetical protein
MGSEGQGTGSVQAGAGAVEDGWRQVRVGRQGLGSESVQSETGPEARAVLVRSTGVFRSSVGPILHFVGAARR